MKRVSREQVDLPCIVQRINLLWTLKSSGSISILCIIIKPNECEGWTTNSSYQQLTAWLSIDNAENTDVFLGPHPLSSEPPADINFLFSWRSMTLKETPTEFCCGFICWLHTYRMLLRGRGQRIKLEHPARNTSIWHCSHCNSSIVQRLHEWQDMCILYLFLQGKVIFKFFFRVTLNIPIMFMSYVKKIFA